MEKYGTIDPCGKEKLANESECKRPHCKCKEPSTKTASVYDEDLDLLCPECNCKQ